MEQDCIFCKIHAGEIPGDFVHRGDDVFVIRDIAPRAPTHLLVIPAKHFGALTDISAEDSPMLEAMFMAAREAALIEGVAEGGYRLVINQGANSGQDVPHLHMHLLGGKRLGSMA